MNTIVSSNLSVLIIFNPQRMALRGVIKSPAGGERTLGENGKMWWGFSKGRSFRKCDQLQQRDLPYQGHLFQEGPVTVSLLLIHPRERKGCLLSRGKKPFTRSSPSLLCVCPQYKMPSSTVPGPRCIKNRNM